MCAIDRLIKPETIGDLPIGRIAKNGFATTNDDRNIGKTHVKPIKQLLNI